MMEITKKRLEYIKIDDVLAYERNARTHSDEQIEQICQSIKEFGFTNPVLIDEQNVLIAGHGRTEAARKLGIKEVPAIRLSGLTESQIKALRIADNKLALNAGWDEELLKIELSELDVDGFDLSLTGFDFEYIDGLLDKVVDRSSTDERQDSGQDDLVSEALTINPVSKYGTVWHLGEHRLMCGDSTNADEIKRFCPKADLLLTDPPYGISVVSGKTVGGGGMTHFGNIGGDKVVKSRKYLEVKNDETTETALIAIDVAKQVTERQIIFGGNYFTDVLPPSRCWLVWDKRNSGNFADCELAWTSFDSSVRKYEWTWNGMCRQGDRKDEGMARIHPTQKPVGLLAEILNDYSKENDVVLDLFGGSGSTLIACEKTGRTCFMVEYEPAYIDLIVKRWQSFTGLEAVRSDGVKFDDLVAETVA